MELTINFKLLKESGLSTKQFIILTAIYNNEFDLLKWWLEPLDVKRSLIALGRTGFIKVWGEDYIFSNVVLREPAHKLFGKDTSTNKVDEWITDWINLWPKGTKSGNHYIKSDKAGCLKKMKVFVKNNRDVTKDMIFKGTKSYLDRKKLEYWKYTMVAHYFISKDGISTLGSEIQNYNESAVTPDTLSGYGTKEL